MSGAGRKPRDTDGTAAREVCSTLTFGSLFSGIGGLDLGLERAGLRCSWQVEIDPYCRSILSAHWPDVPQYADVREVEWADVSAVDVLAGGFPCQPVSLAGKRRAHDDERWLWPEFAKAIAGVRPRFVLIENVPGLRTAGLRDVLADLAALGFDAEWSPVSACSVGAPHMRKRLFILAYAWGERVELGPWLERQEVGGEERHLRHWEAQPEPHRVADGVPRRVDRNRALGNAVVPQVSEVVGRLLMEATT